VKDKEGRKDGWKEGRKEGRREGDRGNKEIRKPLTFSDMVY